MNGIVNDGIRHQMAHASWIRRMFETGLELKQRLGAERVFDFSLGNPDVPPPPAVADALQALAIRATRPLGLGYVPNAGIPSFRAKLAGKLAVEQQTELAAKHVLVTCGAAGALTSRRRGRLSGAVFRGVWRLLWPFWRRAQAGLVDTAGFPTGSGRH